MSLETRLVDRSSSLNASARAGPVPIHSDATASSVPRW
jgi:hypothetical protein